MQLSVEQPIRSSLVSASVGQRAAPESRVQLRPATEADAALLTQVAHDAKRFWGYPAHLIDLWRNQLTIEPGYIAAHTVYVAQLADRPVGFYAVTADALRVTLEHLWVLPGFMHKGIGRTLVCHALDQAQSLGAKAVEVESDPNAEEFFRRMGARCVGQVTYEQDGEPRTLPLLLFNLEEL